MPDTAPETDPALKDLQRRMSGGYRPKIVAAAIRDPDGKVFSVEAPGRHHDVIRVMTEAGSTEKVGRVQGFLTECGVFVNRWMAATIAMRSRQIERPKWGRELYSEDLW